MLGVSGSPPWRTVIGGSQQLRRAGRQAAARRPALAPRCARCAGTATASRCATTATVPHRSTRWSSPPTRTRRCACSPTPTAAEREVLGALPLLPEPDRAAHRRLGCCRPSRAPGVVELPSSAPAAPGRAARCPGQLRHEPAAAARRADATTWSPWAASGVVDPGTVIDRDGLRAPDLHAEPRSPRSAALPELEHRRHRLRRRLPRLGLPRGRLPVRRRRGGPGAGVAPGDDARAVRTPRSRHARRDPLRHTSSRYRTLPVAGRPRRTCPAARLPAPARFARFQARDHLGDPRRAHPRQRRPLPRPSTASTWPAAGS